MPLFHRVSVPQLLRLRPRHFLPQRRPSLLRTCNWRQLRESSSEEHHSLRNFHRDNDLVHRKVISTFKRPNKQYRFQKTAQQITSALKHASCIVCWNIFVGNFLFYWMVVGSNSLTTFDNYRTVGAFLLDCSNFLLCYRYHLTTIRFQKIISFCWFCFSRTKSRTFHADIASSRISRNENHDRVKTFLFLWFTDTRQFSFLFFYNLNNCVWIFTVKPFWSDVLLTDYLKSYLFQV